MIPTLQCKSGGRMLIVLLEGKAFNPARCLGLMVASQTTNGHWIHWVGPAIACLIQGSLYNITSPYLPRSKTADSLPS